MPVIQMKTTAAGPERVLDAGKVYRLPPAVADPLIAGGYAVEYKGDKKPLKLPAQPDPGDKVQVEEEEEEVVE